MTRPFSGLKILVTGGAGFIGSHIVDSLVSQGAKVTVLDNFSFGRIDNLSTVRSKIKIIKADIRDYGKLVKAMEGIDMVSHHAAQLEIIRANNDPWIDLQINLLGTINVLKASRIKRVKKIINASSACVYGQPKYKKQDENHPVEPNWEYGISKLAAEKYCRIFTASFGIPAVSLRYSIVYGPREWYRRVLTIFIKRTIQGKPLVVFGDGKLYRDYVYVADVVKAHNLCLIKKAADGEVINIGSGNLITILKLARLVNIVSGKQLPIIHEQVSEGGESRQVPGKKRNPQDLKGMCLDNKKAKKLLDWQSEVTLPDGIHFELDWAMKNLDQWRKIKYS